MAVHRFVCDKHLRDIVIEDTTAKGIHRCPECNAIMYWDLTGIGIADGDYEHISESLAIHPDQTSEHKKKFPNVDVLPDGRLRFTSVRQQERYASRCGFYKKRQKKKSKGIRIA